MTRIAVEPKTLGVLRSWLAPISLSCVLMLVACRGSRSAPPCGAVGTRLVVLAKQDIETAKLGDETRRLVIDQLPALRDSLVRACSDGEWSDAMRRCLADAQDHAQFETCQLQLTPSQRDALDRSARGETTDH